MSLITAGYIQIRSQILLAKQNVLSNSIVFKMKRTVDITRSDDGAMSRAANKMSHPHEGTPSLSVARCLPSVRLY
jgi:hypothetical protein